MKQANIIQQIHWESLEFHHSASSPSRGSHQTWSIRNSDNPRKHREFPAIFQIDRFHALLQCTNSVPPFQIISYKPWVVREQEMGKPWADLSSPNMQEISHIIDHCWKLALAKIVTELSQRPTRLISKKTTSRIVIAQESPGLLCLSQKVPKFTNPLSST